MTEQERDLRDYYIAQREERDKQVVGELKFRIRVYMRELELLLDRPEPNAKAALVVCENIRKWIS